VLSLKLDDYRTAEKEFTMRESKGRDARIIPVSAVCAVAIAARLRGASAR